ncbi:ATP-dependent RNA helicase DBP2 [Astathelohania contejeani]|uniref:RNA helicase n=1 Tax=Astathelohania contejeani TaxID=164912 RepID=A0ABQ7HZV1_9MICR|nr:ATP-dependent RNA helicase DBP2 [Thelohania contejeani]
MRSYDRNNGRRDRENNNGWSSRQSAPIRREENPPVLFKKNFYVESDEVKAMSPQQVEQFRTENRMKIIGTNIPKPITNFNQIGLSKDVLNDFRKNKFEKPTPIQAQGWPMALCGRDMVGVAQTGSGKTLSFVLPALIHAKDQAPLRNGDGPIVLILAPTRELVLQIKEVAEVYCRHFGMKCTAVYGGVPSYNQKNDLRRGVEVCVATPGRLIDLHDQGACPLGRVTFLVLDEADRMLDMGFEPQLRKIIPKTNDDRQTLMWSATWPKEVRDLAQSYMNDFIQVQIGDNELTSNANIKQTTVVCEDRDKRQKLIEALEKFCGVRGEIRRIIIFSNTKRNCDNLEFFLKERGYSAIAIHGDKAQNARDRIISDFKSGYKNILIATDVAARGLDVKDVKVVINYDFPGNCEDYVHRIGRTARGSCKEGASLTFFTYNDRNNAREFIKLLTSANQEVPKELREMAPSDGHGRRISRYGGYSSGPRRGGEHKRW